MADRRQLRVYLGAAPGVGKSYAMLGEARRRAGRGTDVVVGGGCAAPGSGWPKRPNAPAS